MKLLVTGGAGFIGSALIRYLLSQTTHSVINFDKLTYAGNLQSLSSLQNQDRYFFLQEDILNKGALEFAFEEYKPDSVLHLAAESHVDRSLKNPDVFIQTNVVGTYNLLEVARSYYHRLSGHNRERFRFLNVSTDEVFGDLDENQCPSDERANYAPSSPYAASKAASDHFVRAWGRSFGLPVIVSICSNNFGPFQYPDKFIPKLITNALQGENLTIYGDGQQIRDWIYVVDHAVALEKIISGGITGATYNIGADEERKNMGVVLLLCELLEELAPVKPTGVLKYRDLISYVGDRPGHDKRYALDARRLREELEWSPKQTFVSALRSTVEWYLANRTWWEHLVLNPKDDHSAEVESCETEL